MPTKNKNPGLKLFTKTWPLKREKKVKNEHNICRPLTATLEKPLVLDIRLAGKVDMSLVRKEFLNISNLCKLPLILRKKNKENVRPLSLLGTEIYQNKKKKSDTEDDESSVIQSAKNCRAKSNPKSSKKGSKRSVIYPMKKNSPVQIISDANNNKMSKEPPRKITSEKLTSVTNPLPMPTDLLKPSTKQIPEPCRTCGRLDQPERLHSHPATPLEVTPIIGRKNLRSPANIKKMEVNNKIPVKSSVQKPVAIKYHSKNGTQEIRNRSPIKKGTESTPKTIAIKVGNTQPTQTQSLSAAVLRLNKCVANPEDTPGHFTANKNSTKTVNLGMNSKKTVMKNRVVSGKRTLTCYICGREFGTASLPLHEPKCLEKWERENSQLPSNLRRTAPVKPEGNISQEEWNERAWEASQASLVPCLNCKRTFYPDRLMVHQRSCKPLSPNKNLSSNNLSTTSSSMSQTSDRNSTPSSSAPKGPPPMAECYICGRKFGTHSIEIHERNCLKKWHAENESLPPDMRTAPPVKTGHKPSLASPQQRPSNTSTSKVKRDSKEDRPASGSKAPLFPCYLCGKLFSVHSIYLHEPQCLKMWQIENDKLPPNKRRQQPLKPDIKFTRSGKLNIEATTDAFWKSHLDQLIPCKMCARTFNPDRVAVHEKSCRGN